MLLSRALEDISRHIWIQSSATLSLNMSWGNWIPTWSHSLSSYAAIIFCTMSSGEQFPLDTYLGTFLSNRILPEWGKKESFCMQLQILKVIVFQSRYALYFITRAFQGRRPSWNSGLILFPFGRKSQLSPHHACVIVWVWRMREVLTYEHTEWCNGGRRAKRSSRRAKSAQTQCVRRSKRIQNMLTSFAVDPH